VRERIVVVALIAEREDKFLVARRLKGTHLAGCWEFPGGKVHANETNEAALEREIDEELGCRVVGLTAVFRTSHEYPGRTVELIFFRGKLVGTPAGRLGQELKWIPREEFASLEFPPADAELIDELLHQRL
jgi:8-oxo-dGTP diphosphatase